MFFVMFSYKICNLIFANISAKLRKNGLVGKDYVAELVLVQVVFLLV